VCEAAAVVGDTFRRLDPSVRQPNWKLDAREGGERSVGLSTIVASLISFLSLTRPT